MLTPTILPIQGYQSVAVPNRFYRQSDTACLAVLFPGYRYSCEMPILYYPGQLMLTRGADVLQVDYFYDAPPDFDRRGDDPTLRQLYADAEAALEAGLRQRRYEQVLLIGKSLGTAAMAHLLSRYSTLPRSAWVWLTPALDPIDVKRILTIRPQSLVVVGTADPWYDANRIGELEQVASARCVVIEKANHGLLIDGDIRLSVQALERVVGEMESFLNQ
jgi:dienelactone hydrolase